MGTEFLCNTAGWMMTSWAQRLPGQQAPGQDASAGGCSSAPAPRKGRLAGSASLGSAPKTETCHFNYSSNPNCDRDQLS